VPSLRPTSAPSAPSTPSAPSASSPPAGRSLLMDRAKTVQFELHTLFRARHQNLADIAHALLAVKREELFAYLGYTSVFDYAWSEHRMGKSKVSELIGISKATEGLPKIREAFDEGELEWTKARELIQVATPETEDVWLTKAAASTTEELRAERRGAPPARRRVLAFPEEAAALFDQLVAGAKQELGVVSDWRAVLELMKRGASGEGGDGPVQRVVISECPTCGEASVESREGPVRVSQATLELARRDGEVHDLRQEDNVVKRAIPAKVKRRVFDRDRRRCRVPGCGSMAGLVAHHLKGWRCGHDPDGILTLCWWHHRVAHRGLLRIEGTAASARFVRLDGVVLGASASEAAVAYENEAAIAYENEAAVAYENEAAVAYENEVAVAYENSDRRRNAPPVAAVAVGPKAEEDPVRDATLALRSLGMRTREAKTCIQVALGCRRDLPWTAGELVKAALLAS